MTCILPSSIRTFSFAGSAKRTAGFSVGCFTTMGIWPPSIRRLRSRRDFSGPLRTSGERSVIAYNDVGHAAAARLCPTSMPWRLLPPLMPPRLQSSNSLSRLYGTPMCPISAQVCPGMNSLSVCQNTHCVLCSTAAAAAWLSYDILLTFRQEVQVAPIYTRC